jgi:hypothetical protein
MRSLVLGGLLAAAGCAAQQGASNVGGDGLERAAAAIALESIEPGACSEHQGLRGAVQMVVVFSPEGNVLDAAVSRGGGGPSAGVSQGARGACLVGRLRELHVPPFKGGPTKVTRRLTLE